MSVPSFPRELFSEGSVTKSSPARFSFNETATSKSVCKLHDLGPVLSEVLQRVPLRDRLAVACASRSLRDYVYDRHELWSNVSASTCSEAGAEQSPFHALLQWTSSRQKVQRFRVVLRDRDLSAGSLAFCDDLQKNMDCGVGAVIGCVASLHQLTSLSVRLDDGVASIRTSDAASRLVAACPPSLRQLTIVTTDIGVAVDPKHLTALTALSLTAAGATVAAPTSLPPSLKRLSIGGLCEPQLPCALASLRSLESLSIHWASSELADVPTTPDLSLLETSNNSLQLSDARDWGRAPPTANWTAHLTHLSLGYFSAAALPSSLPPTLRSLNLQWNLQASGGAEHKAQDFDVDTFHSSFSALEPLTQLTHLNLNNALGGWGLPPSLLKLTQLECLGVAGSCPLADWGVQQRSIAPQLSAFPRLRRLDIDILEATEGWMHVAALTKLEDLRLGKSAAAEEYVRREVRHSIGRGLVCLLPSLPELRAVHTEGMMFPATSVCGRWNRLLGMEALELREEALSAVEALQQKNVELDRWYSWPFLPTANGGKDWVPWDEVM